MLTVHTEQLSITCTNQTLSVAHICHKVLSVLRKFHRNWLAAVFLCPQGPDKTVKNHSGRITQNFYSNKINQPIIKFNSMAHVISKSRGKDQMVQMMALSPSNNKQFAVQQNNTGLKLLYFREFQIK